MKLDRGEAQGTGVALLLHVALVVALTTSLATMPKVPEPPAVEVEFVDSDEVALTAAAPTPATPPPAAEAPAPADQAPAPPEPQPAPALTPPPPQPIVRPTPAPVARPLPNRPAPPQARPAPARARPAPARPAPAQARPAPARPAPPRQSRLGDDFLRGIPNPDLDLSPRPARQGAAIFSAAAKASVDSAIKRQIQPCANRQPTLGPGADRIRVTVNLRLDRAGRLSRPPSLVRTSGVDDDNQRFEDLAYDQAVAVFRACSPLRLPAELYSTPQGGWGNINLTYAAK
ncbi:cell envelope biogenesis protein TolA [Sphingomonas sp. LHG3406-1]|uniref:cell envelope biogenesis protein TolA n=1 Tax=Sphingomonas sp. LHG3406-1 TaxID=2804617 RepID=UPI002627855E|nr:cell envelope biogenesis protein TolA [Sphingomonas sp. LHG3406-1]